jgi:hypothetical protein
MAVKCSRVNAEKPVRADHRLDFDVANVAARVIRVDLVALLSTSGLPVTMAVVIPLTVLLIGRAGFWISIFRLGAVLIRSLAISNWDR